jgi:predicted transcriptional regulator
VLLPCQQAILLTSGDFLVTNVNMTGDELRNWRSTHSLTQRAAALRLNCSYSAICRWETGKRKIPMFLRDAIRRAEDNFKRKDRRARATG